MSCHHDKGQRCDCKQQNPHFAMAGSTPKSRRGNRESLDGSLGLRGMFNDQMAAYDNNSHYNNRPPRLNTVSDALSTSCADTSLASSYAQSSPRSPNHSFDFNDTSFGGGNQSARDTSAYFSANSTAGTSVLTSTASSRTGRGVKRAPCRPRRSQQASLSESLRLPEMFSTPRSCTQGANTTMNTSYPNQSDYQSRRSTMNTTLSSFRGHAANSTFIVPGRPPRSINTSQHIDHSQISHDASNALGVGEPLYEIDNDFVNSLRQGDGEYVVSLKNKLENRPIQQLTVIEHFHRLMKELLGERLYASLLKKGVLSKNLPDEIITRKIMDALELKNKLLFSSTDPTISALDKLNFIQAAGSFRGALRAAMSATANVKETCLEDIASEEVAEYEGLFLKHDKPKPEIRVLGYVGVTNLD